MDPLAFIGVRVNVTLRNGLSIHATVRTIGHEDGRAILRLEHVLFPLNGATTDSFSVAGDEIADLEIFKDPNDALSIDPPAAEATRATPHVNNISGRSKRQLPKTVKATKTRREAGGRQDVHSAWADQDPQVYHESEFDFEGNLAAFDKRAVFAEIRSMDETAPDSLLVACNRLVKSPLTVPLTGSVPGTNTGLRRHWETLEGGITVPHVNDAEVAELAVLLSGVSGELCPPWEVHVDAAGRGIAELMLRTLKGTGSGDVDTDDEAPAILVLAGGGACGEYALSAGRQLANLGLAVTAMIEACATPRALRQGAWLMHAGATVAFEAEAVPLFGGDRRLIGVIDGRCGAVAPTFPLPLQLGLPLGQIGIVTVAVDLPTPGWVPNAVAVIGLPRTQLRDSVAKDTPVLIVEAGIPRSVWTQMLQSKGLAWAPRQWVTPIALA